MSTIFYEFILIKFFLTYDLSEGKFMNISKFIKDNKLPILFAVFTLLLGFAVSIFVGNTDMYKELIKPPFSPPGFLFPIAWTILYILMGVSAGIVAESNDLDKAYAIKLYILQLLLNVLWPVLFFGLQASRFALFWLVLLIIVAIMTIKTFSTISRKAAVLFFPYIVWLFYAFYLNFGIVVLNS